MSDKMVEEMARAMREKLHELDADPPFHADALAQAAATIAERRMEEMREALGECQDKLWVLHFSLTDKAERQAAIDACNMANAALRSSGGV
jgi:hypothetical protein